MDRFLASSSTAAQPARELSSSDDMRRWLTTLTEMIEKSIWVREVLSFLDTRGLCRVQYICKSLALNSDSDWKPIVMCRWPSLGPNIDLLASCMGNCKELYFRRARAFANIGTLARPLTRRPVLPTDLMFSLAISHGGIVIVETTFSIEQNLENRIPSF